MLTEMGQDTDKNPLRVFGDKYRISNSASCGENLPGGCFFSFLDFALFEVLLMILLFDGYIAANFLGLR